MQLECLDIGAHRASGAHRDPGRLVGGLALHNTHNPAVQEEIRKIMGFYLQLGVCGFRASRTTPCSATFASPRGRHHIILEPFGYRWFRVGGLGDLLDREA